MKHNWEYKRLGSLCNIVRGGSPRPIQDFLTDASDGLNWIKIGDVSAGSKYITSTKERIKKEGLVKTRQVFVGDFILSNSMSFGRPYILKIDGCIHDGWLAIKGVENHFIADFLYYFLSSPSTYSLFEKLVKGGVVSNLNSDIVKGIDVPVPTMEEQERIVAELDKINELIGECRELLRNLDALAQSLFHSLFNDLIAKKNNWPQCCIGDIYKFQYGKGNKIPKSNGIYPCYGSNGIVGFHTEYNSEDAPIIGHIGAYAGIVNWGKGKHFVTYNGVMCWLKSKQNNPIYGFYLLKSQNYLKMARNGAAQPFVSYDGLENPIVYLPPTEIQEQFAKRIELIDAQKKDVEELIANLQTLLDSRMDYWFN